MKKASEWTKVSLWTDTEMSQLADLAACSRTSTTKGETLDLVCVATLCCVKLAEILTAATSAETTPNEMTNGRASAFSGIFMETWP
uniref:Uncharacterized protein n=1 Tax=Ditylenchus dipsaci TaxID=166011 RepID=A0A915DJN2_9BILA